MKPTLLLLPTLLLGSLSDPLHAVDYKEEIRPILNDKCYKCHSGPRAKGKLRMDSESDFADRIGGEDPVIRPGNAANSLLAIKAGLPRTDGDAMPPPPARARGSEPMTASELNLVKRWIAEGAKFDPNAPAPEPAAPTTSTDPATPTEPTAPANEIHSWTNTSDVTIEASFLSLEGGNISLKTEAGEVYTFPSSRLSPESQALASKLASL